MDLKPVNKIDSDANTIRVSDGNSPIRLIFKDVKGEVINLYDKIDYFYLTKDDEKYYSVTDISYDGDEVIIRLPKLRKGKYKAEIRDKDGSIYPANEDLYILLRRSFEDDKDIYYFGHREDILNSVEPIIIQHIEQNPNKFRGERGQQGFPGRDGLRGIDGKDGENGIDGEKGEKGDPGKEVVAYINVKDFGAKGDNITDDTKSINDAILHAKTTNSQSVIYFPEGDYKTSDTLKITNPIEGLSANINYHGNETALIIGDDSAPGIVTSRKYYKVPRVIYKKRPETGWDGNSVGVKCVNLNTCDITIPFVQNFETGLLMYGYTQGCSYNTVHLGALWDNHKNLVIDSDEDGWSNQTLYLGGRLQHSLNKGAFENDPDAYQIKVGGTTPSSNNTFINTSVEGYNLSVYRVHLNGSFNVFMNNRFENHSPQPPKVFYESGANYNKIIGGYHTHTLVEEFANSSTRGGNIDDGVTPIFKGTLTENQLIPNNDVYRVLKGLTTETHRTTFNNETGELFLKPGKWKVSVKATFGQAEGGSLSVRIVKGDGTVIASQALRPDSQYQFSMVTEAVDSFIDGQPLRVEIRQGTSTPELTLNRGQFTTITATYLGGI